MPPSVSGNDVVGAATMPPVGSVGQRLEREQRPQHRIAPLTRVVAPRRPALPVLRRCGSRAGPRRSVPAVRSCDGNQPSTNGTRSRRPTVNSAVVFRFSPTQIHRRAQLESVGAGDRLPRAVETAHPRNDRAVVEAHDELHATSRTSPLDPLDDAHEQRPVAARSRGSRRRAHDRLSVSCSVSSTIESGR